MNYMDSRIFTKIKKGQVIPGFTLETIDNETLSSDILLRKKNLVLFFFNQLTDKCCQDYLLMLNNISSQSEDSDTQILAISSEKPGLLQEFKNEHAINFTFLLDPQRKVINKFTYKDKEGNNICALFITDKFQSLYKPYFHQPFGRLPDKEEIISSIEFLEKQCPECGVTTWEED